MDLVSFKYAIQKAHECQGDNTKHAQLKPITLHINIPTRRDGILILRDNVTSWIKCFINKSFRSYKKPH